MAYFGSHNGIYGDGVGMQIILYLVSFTYNNLSPYKFCFEKVRLLIAVRYKLCYNNNMYIYTVIF